MAGKACLCPPRHLPLALLLLSHAGLSDVWVHWRVGSGRWGLGWSRRLTPRAYSPVLRSLAHLNPTMPLEEGLRRAVQEWRRRSNLDRMIYYETAQK